MAHGGSGLQRGEGEGPRPLTFVIGGIGRFCEMKNIREKQCENIKICPLKWDSLAFQNAKPLDHTP